MNEELKNKLLAWVINAIRNTDPKYYKAFNYVLYERIFCYEFYHQLRIQQESLNENFLISGLSDVLVSGELGKKIENNLDRIRDVFVGEEKIKDREYEKFPDFVFHGGLEDTKEEKQLMVIEVKRKSGITNESLKNDIRKLITLTNEKNLKFQIGLFIAVGMTRCELKEELKKLEEDVLSCPHFDKIYFIATEDIIAVEKYCICIKDILT